MNNRRKLLAALGAGALAAPFSSFGQQQGKVWRVGFLATRHLDFVDADPYYGPFRQGMRELGYVEGKNLVVEWRSAESKTERLPDLAAELVRLKMDVIVTEAAVATLAAQKGTSTIPIVMANVGDPVGTGVVKSLARPGGNTTGLSNMVSELVPKHLELLLSIVPKVSRVAFLWNSANSSQLIALKSVQAAAQKVGVKILPLEAQTPQQIENAFSVMAREKPGAVIVAQNPFAFQQRRQIAELAAKIRLPSISGSREYAEAGGLIGYGASIADGSRRAASYVDKIFKGAKPGDLPVEQSTLFELVINRNTAKAMGITFPQSLLVRADRVIE
jgi:putative ABC transport system substrate-binding protein